MKCSWCGAQASLGHLRLTLGGLLCPACRTAPREWAAPRRWIIHRKWLPRLLVAVLALLLTDTFRLGRNAWGAWSAAQ